MLPFGGLKICGMGGVLSFGPPLGATTVAHALRTIVNIIIKINLLKLMFFISAANIECLLLLIIVEFDYLL
jgi:hypothetical protein